MNKTLLQYLLRRTITPFLFSLFISTLLLALLSFVKYSDIFISIHLSLWDMIKVILLLIPLSLEFSIPLSMMISLLYVVYTMSVNNEILALELNGINRFEVIKPFLLLSIVAFLINIFSSIFVFPATIYRMKDIAIKYVRLELVDSLKDNRINDDIPDIMIFFRDRDRDGNFKDLYLFQKNINSSRMLVYAREAEITADKGRLAIDMSINNGRIIDISKSGLRDVMYKSGAISIDGADLIEKRVKNIRGIYGNVPGRGREMEIWDAIYLSLASIWIAILIVLIFVSRIYNAGYTEYILFLISVGVYYIGFKVYHTIVENGLMNVPVGCIFVLSFFILLIILFKRLLIIRWL